MGVSRVLLGAWLLAACEVGDREDLGRGGGPPVSYPAVSSVSESPPSAAPATDEQTPLVADEPVITLPLERHRAAIVSLPVGTTSPRPVLVAAHGRDDLPAPLCDMWRGLVGERAFVVCPTGAPSSTRPGSFTYESPAALDAEIDAALAALRARFPEHVAAGSTVYAGFSLGSFFGVHVACSAPARTPRVILIEGGHDPWTERAIASFVDGGGERVLFVTGQTANEQRSRALAAELERAGIASRVVHAEGAGHVYTGSVRERLAEAFDWVVEGDDRWKK